MKNGLRNVVLGVYGRERWHYGNTIVLEPESKWVYSRLLVLYAAFNVCVCVCVVIGS